MAEPAFGFLVWIRAPLPNDRLGRKGVTAEKWPLDAIDAVKNGKTVLARHPITAEEWRLKLPILEARYPAPQLPEEAACQ